MTALEDSIVLITSTDPQEAHFGSGFVIHQDDSLTYLVTCAHVVADVGGEKKVKVGKFQAAVVNQGSSHGCDLAILKVEEILANPPLKVCLSAESGQSFTIAGFYQPTGVKTKTLRPISGNLGEQIIIEFEGDRTSAWDLEIDDNGKHYLESGYSGSPVVNTADGCVIGVAAIAQDGGKQGLAISIGAIEKIWQAIPDSLKLEALQVQKTTSELRVKQIQSDISNIEQQLQADLKPDLKPALDWLYDQAGLAKKAGDYALKNSPALKAAIEAISDLELRETAKKDFTWELESYLELIYFSLLLGDNDLLDEPVVTPSQPIDAYNSAFTFIKERIPPRTAAQIATQIKLYIDYLVQRLS